VHQKIELNLDAGAMELYRHNADMRTNYRAIKKGCIRFESTGVTASHHSQSKLHAVQSHDPEGGHNPTDSIYTSAIGECFHALPKHVRQLVGNVPDIALPANFDCIVLQKREKDSQDPRIPG
jgi:hypothetical protein